MGTIIATNDKVATDGGGGGGGGGGGRRGGGYGRGGGGGSTGPTPEQGRAGGNLGGITGFNAETIKGSYDNSMDMYDISDEQNQNLRDTQKIQTQRKMGTDWFRRYKDLQTVTSQLTDASGTAMRGSYTYDLNDLIAALDDAIDAETLETMRDNFNSIDNSYFESLAQLNNSRNDLAMSTEQALRELGADYSAQLNNIHPDLAAGIIDSANHTLKMPDWLNTDFYDEHKVEAAEPDDYRLTRPDRANDSAYSQGIKTTDRNTAQTASGDYWSRLMSGYNNRYRQA